MLGELGLMEVMLDSNTIDLVVFVVVGVVGFVGSIESSFVVSVDLWQQESICSGKGGTVVMIETEGISDSGSCSQIVIEVRAGMNDYSAEMSEKCEKCPK